jgi:glycosyltransferase involved in cell wall biosynthesis
VLDELRRYEVKKEIRVISNPIETDVFQPLSNRNEFKKKWGITKPAVLCFGRLAKEKNLEELFEAFTLARKKIDASLIVVGDGAERQALGTKAETLGIQNDVHFLGILRSEELVEAINATDVYAITSRSETQSMTMLQSMACGLPIVAIDKGALPEIISHEKNGYVVASGDTESFASRLVELLKDASLRDRYGKHGREYVLTLSPLSIAGQMEAAYEKACQTFLSSSSSRS